MSVWVNALGRDVESRLNCGFKDASQGCHADSAPVLHDLLFIVNLGEPIIVMRFRKRF